MTELLASLSGVFDSHFESLPAPAKPAPLNVPLFGTQEVLEVLDSLLRQEVTMGQKVSRFERAFAEYLGVRHAVMVNSGSSANLLILSALSNPRLEGHRPLVPGDEVLVPAVTWSTTLAPVIQVGAVPVLVDAELDTLNMSVEAAARAIGPKTRALFVAHILGNSADMDGFRALAREHGLILLEDSCESLGTRYKGELTGRMSTLASFSFYLSHHITTIEGGMVVTDDDALAELCRCLRAHGWTRSLDRRAKIEAAYPHIDPRFLFWTVGYNLRPTELQGAFGLHQLGKLEAYNTRRRVLAAEMRARLLDLDAAISMAKPTPGVDPPWFGFPMLLSERFADQRAAFIAHLEARGVETRPIVAGNLAAQPMLETFPHRVAGALPNASAIMRRGVYWACHPSMTPEQIDLIAGVVREFFVQRGA